MYLKTLLCFLICPFALLAQNVVLSGYISDKTSGENLVAANIYLEELQTGATTNEYGFFSIQVPKEHPVSCSFSYVGYETLRFKFTIETDTILKIELAPSALLKEVVVKGDKTRKEPDKANVSLQTLMNMPVIGGEGDIMKSLSLFPGISTGQEGSSHLYVRGGTPDQNLILLDGVPVYNVNHLGGFLSVFNPKALNNVDVMKGNFPARYGGRLSSVIDITMKEGNKKEFEGSFGFGLVTSSLSLEGPIRKDKSSFILTARSSYLGLINRLMEGDNDEDTFNYWLYDVNLKTNFSLGKGKLFFSVYSGTDNGIIRNKDNYSGTGDVLKTLSEEENKIAWGNTTISSRYTIPIGAGMYAKFLVGYSKYQYRHNEFMVQHLVSDTDTSTTKSSIKNISEVEDVLMHANFDWSIAPFYHLKYGIGSTLHHFRTGTREQLSGAVRDNAVSALEHFAYLDNQIQITPRFSTDLGLRWSAWKGDGASFSGLEPRVSAAYEAGNVTLTAALAYTRQYIHWLNSKGFGFSNNVWVAATKNVPPEKAVQASVGAEYVLPKGIDLTFGAYYKKLYGQIDFNTLLENPFTQIVGWENLVETGGKGYAYGTEWLFHKKGDKLDAYLAYTLSWNYRQFDNLNQGKKYPFTYDRRHDIALILQYQASEKWSFSANWVYQTGTAVTLPVGLLAVPSFSGESDPGGPNFGDFNVQEIFAGRNNGRLPAYHRLDVGAKRTKQTKKGRTLIWDFSVYNFYNRKNTSYLELTGSKNHEQGYNVRRVSLLGFIPAVGFEYKF